MSTCQRCGRVYAPLRRGFCHTCDMRRRAMVGYECSYVAAEPVRQHIKRLQAAGLGRRRISALSGVCPSVIQGIINGRSRAGRREPPRKRISKGTAEKILAVPIPEPDTVARLAANTARVSRLGTARRIKALVAIGYTQADIAERIGWSPANLSKLLDEDGLVSARTARTIDALYRKLCMTPGPSGRARQRAKKLGWAPPLAWDDIDDPAETPNIGAERRVSFAERYVEMRELGMRNHEIAARMGINLESLDRQLYRYGLKEGR